jgi:transposase
MKSECAGQEVLYGNKFTKSAKRLALTALLVRESIEPQAISRIVGVSQRQMYNYRTTYETHGTAALLTDVRYRPSSELEAYKDIIKEDLIAHPAATAAEASERILSLTGIKRSPTQVRAFMRHHLGLKPLQVAQIPAKANPAAQSVFLETDLEPRIQEAQEGKRALLFMDAAHFVWQLYLGVLWCVSRIFIPAASGRTRINVLGAYDPIKNELIKIINRTYITSLVVIQLLEKIRAVYLEQAITIVLDNAKYQRCKAVMDKASELRIELLFLPTYPPNLNLIERLWRFVK